MLCDCLASVPQPIEINHRKINIKISMKRFIEYLYYTYRILELRKE